MGEHLVSQVPQGSLCDIDHDTGLCVYGSSTECVEDADAHHGMKQTGKVRVSFPN